MKHSRRRQETGKMLMDVVKYMLTVGFIGSALSERFTVTAGIVILIGAIIIFLIAFFTIPTEKEVN